MSIDLQNAKALLLDLISPIRPVSTASIETLSADDWQILLAMAHLHRLAPMLHWRLTHERKELPVPREVLATLAERFRQATLRALTLQRELLLVHRILQRAEIPHVALKGAYLAFHAYQHPALRPLRDLDILVPKEQALAAYQTLLDNGLQRIDAYGGDVAAALEVHHHLPPLRTPSSMVTVELHSRLFSIELGENRDIDLSRDPQFWQRCVSRTIADASISFESATDLLLHMIVHAVYDHQFNNGPLLLSDLACLLESSTIDWPLFWGLAERGQHTRGCVLALKLMERYWGAQDIRWPAGLALCAATLPIDEAASLMLRDASVQFYASLGHKVTSQSSLQAKAKLLLGKAFPPRQVIASMYPVSAQSAQVYLWYPARWWKMTAQKLPGYLRSLHQPHLQQEMGQISELQSWLQTDTGPAAVARTDAGPT